MYCVDLVNRQFCHIIKRVLKFESNDDHYHNNKVWDYISHIFFCLFDNRNHSQYMYNVPRFVDKFSKFVLPVRRRNEAELAGSRGKK